MTSRRPDVLRSRTNTRDFAPRFLRAFSRSECDRIRALARGRPIRAEILTSYSSTVLDRRARSASLFRVTKNRHTRWLFDRIEAVVRRANLDAWHVQLDDLFEPLSLLRYSIGDHHAMHSDIGTGAFADRKLSFSLQLSPATAYEGGDVSWLSGPTLPRRVGTLAVFPSFAAHQVRPVTSGTRWSLIGWAVGDPYR